MLRGFEMTARLIGESGSRKRRSFLFLPILLVACTALFYIAGAQAVHDTGVFQLDGDAATATNTAGTPTATDDWDKVCYEVGVRSVALGGGGLSSAAAAALCGIGTPTSGATETAWTAEPDPAASIFTGGGSKDPQNLYQWAWKDAGGLPDKDNLLHAYAARYSLTPSAHCPSGGAATCEVLFAGLDRFDNSGDAQNGVWFFQSKVTTAGAKSGGGTGFTGLHTNGDLLIVSDFSNGGTTSTITVYTWDSACTATNKPFGFCADANLHLQETSDNANCKAQDVPTPKTGDAFCGIVNPSTITMPWSFTDKSGTAANGALNGEFYEEGINLSLLGLAGTCFSSVLSETRSSTSTTATLKDFVLGQLGNCNPNLTTQVQKAGVDFNGTVAPGTPVNDTAKITVTGASTPDDATGTVDFSLCFSATAYPDCSTGGTAAGTGKVLTDTSSPANTHDGISGATSNSVNTTTSPLATGFYCFRAVATLTNYSSPGAFTNTTTECFRVSDTTSITTSQKWLPQDTATIATGSGAAVPAGTVVFSLYLNGTCAGTAATTFTDSDGTDGYATNNTTYQTASTTISWSATFTPTDPTNISGSTTTRCETSVLTITNNSGPFPPA
jgi:hypothetical protein